MDQTNVQVNNLDEENTVGCANYETGISNLESASRKIVLNRCSDLLKKTDPSRFTSYRKRALAIKKLKTEWNLKMTGLEQKGYTDKKF